MVIFEETSRIVDSVQKFVMKTKQFLVELSRNVTFLFICGPLAVRPETKYFEYTFRVYYFVYIEFYCEKPFLCLQYVIQMFLLFFGLQQLIVSLINYLGFEIFFIMLFRLQTLIRQNEVIHLVRVSVLAFSIFLCD